MRGRSEGCESDVPIVLTGGGGNELAMVDSDGSFGLTKNCEVNQHSIELELQEQKFIDDQDASCEIPKISGSGLKLVRRLLYHREFSTR